LIQVESENLLENKKGYFCFKLGSSVGFEEAKSLSKRSIFKPTSIANICLSVFDELSQDKLKSTSIKNTVFKVYLI
jgi:hypothetical protein